MLKSSPFPLLLSVFLLSFLRCNAVCLLAQPCLKVSAARLSFFLSRFLPVSHHSPPLSYRLSLHSHLLHSVINSESNSHHVCLCLEETLTFTSLSLSHRRLFEEETLFLSFTLHYKTPRWSLFAMLVFEL